MYELKPIRTNTDHARALRELDRLIALDPKPKSKDADRIELLTILIEAFERTHPDHRIDDKVDPVGAIEFHLERLGMTTKDLETVLGATRGRVWEILHRKRPLTLAQIRVLVRELGISADRLIAEYERPANQNALAERQVRTTVRKASANEGVGKHVRPAAKRVRRSRSA